MKAIQLRDSFGLSNLQLVDIDLPNLEADEVLVEIKSRSLNYRDFLMITGKYNPNQKLPLIPLSDSAGIIVEVGKEAQKEWKEGDFIINTFVLNWLDGVPPSKKIFKHTLGGPLDGTWSQYRIFKKDQIVKAPFYLSFEEASSLPCAAVTAYNALITYAKATSNSTILIIGTGGVSIFALQIAQALNARVIVLTGDETKIDFIQKMGVDLKDIINYKKYPNWYKEVLKKTNNEGVDLVVEVGGIGTLENSLRSVKIGGHISLIGVLAGGVGDLNLRYIFMNNISMQGIFVGSKKNLINLCSFMNEYRIQPIIDKVFDFQDTSSIKYLASKKHIGKICMV